MISTKARGMLVVVGALALAGCGGLAGTRDGRPIGYALLHRTGVHASLQDWNGKTVLFLSAIDFIDPGYIRSGNGRDGRKH